MLSRLGTDYASIYFISRLRALGDPHLIAAHLRVAFKPVAVRARLRGRAGVLRRARSAGNCSAEAATVALRVMAVCLPFAVIYDVCLAATRGFGTVNWATLLEKLIRPGLQLLLLAIVATTHQAKLLAIAWALPYVMVLPVAVVVLYRLIRGENVKQQRRRAATSLPRSGVSPRRAASPGSRRRCSSGSTSSSWPRCSAPRMPRSTRPRPASWCSGSWATRPSPHQSSRDCPHSWRAATSRARGTSTACRPPG